MESEPLQLHTHLKAWRNHFGLTQEQLANKIGSKYNTISGWETGNRAVDLKDLQKLADCYGVHASLLLMEPPGTEQFARLQRADEILKRMPASQGEKWLEFGEASLPPEPPKE